MDKHIYEITAAEQLYREHDGESYVYQEYWTPYARVIAISRGQARALFTRYHDLAYLTPMSIKKVLSDIGEAIPHVIEFDMEKHTPEWWEYVSVSSDSVLSEAEREALYA